MALLDLLVNNGLHGGTVDHIDAVSALLVEHASYVDYERLPLFFTKESCVLTTTKKIHTHLCKQCGKIENSGYHSIAGAKN